MLKLIRHLLPLILILALSPLTFADTSDSPEQLRKENQALKDRVRELEKKLADAEQKLRSRPFGEIVPAPKTQPFAIPKAPSPAPFFRFDRDAILPTPDQSTPKHWQERQFNGEKFYIVPLENARR
jgi:hypothetical protein